MRMIPAEVTIGTPSDGEKRLFKMLRGVNLGGDEVCFHSLGLSRHLYQQLGEVDFVIVGPRGLLLLEVKGGRVSRAEGRWVFRNRWGDERRENRGPIKQVENNMFSLLKRLDEHLGFNLRRKHVAGFGAVFTDVDWDIRSTEWEEGWIADRRVLQRSGGLRGFLLDLYAQWERSHRQPTEPMSWQLQSRIIRFLRPDFDLVPTLGQLGESIESRLTSLTENQYEKLDFVDAAPRALVQGGGGTGKTMLATHVARQEASVGRSVTLVCHSPVLSEYLDDQLDGSGVLVATIDEPDPPPADVLIVDEGQDVLNMDALVRLDGWVAGGLSGGRWRIFFDQNNQAGVVGRFESDALELLVEHSFAPLKLTDNCRNTTNIVRFVQAVTGADTGVSTAGIGPPVTLLYYESQREGGEMLGEHLDELVGDGVDPSLIAVLSGEEPGMRLVDQLPPKWKRRLLELGPRTVTAPAPGKVVASSIDDFKGLERRFIILTDVGGLSQSREDQSKLYVALTRPRAGLVVFAEQQLENTFDELLSNHQILLEGGNNERTR